MKGETPKKCVNGPTFSGRFVLACTMTPRRSELALSLNFVTKGCFPWVGPSGLNAGGYPPHVLSKSCNQPLFHLSTSMHFLTLHSRSCLF